MYDPETEGDEDWSDPLGCRLCIDDGEDDSGIQEDFYLIEGEEINPHPFIEQMFKRWASSKRPKEADPVVEYDEQYIKNALAIALPMLLIADADLSETHTLPSAIARIQPRGWEMMVDIIRRQMAEKEMSWVFKDYFTSAVGALLTAAFVATGDITDVFTIVDESIEGLTRDLGILIPEGEAG